MGKSLDRFNLAAERSQQFWRHQFRRKTTVDWVVLGAAIIVALSLWLHMPAAPPGAAIGALGVVAAIMTFSRPTLLQRCIVIALSVGLYLIEMRLISEDRITQKAAEDRTIQEIINNGKDDTSKILRNAQINYENTKGGIDSSLDKVKALGSQASANLALSRANLLNTTGGNSFPYIAAQDHGGAFPIRLVVWNAGKYTLTGVNVVIDRVTTFPWTRQEEDIGTIPPGRSREMKDALYPHMDDVKYAPGNSNYFDAYWIFITAQNGVVQQMLEFRPARNGGWAHRFWLQRVGCELRGKRLPRCIDVRPSFPYPEDVGGGGKWSDDGPAPK